MQVDFHYYAIKCLALTAGFPDNEAQAIACASQYTDNSTESKPIPIDDPPGIASDLVSDGMFDPVCTAHAGIQYASLIFKSKDKKRHICRKIYIPFHFLPAEKYSGTGSYDYRVRRDSPWARELVENAANEVARNRSGLDRRLDLVRLGVTLHMFADTWSHESFSGRRSRADNHVKGLRLSGENRRGGWRRWPVINILYDIGHAEILHVPDMSHLDWSCRHVDAEESHAHDNPQLMLEAAKRIYDLLCRAIGSQPDWERIRDRVGRCLAAGSGKPEDKGSTWRILFPEYSLFYSHKEWRQASLVGAGYDWDGMRDAKQFASLRYTARAENIDWFLFHVAALEHRQRVMDNIKADLA